MNKCNRGERNWDRFEGSIQSGIGRAKKRRDWLVFIETIDSLLTLVSSEVERSIQSKRIFIFPFRKENRSIQSKRRPKALRRRKMKTALLPSIGNDSNQSPREDETEMFLSIVCKEGRRIVSNGATSGWLSEIYRCRENSPSQVDWTRDFQRKQEERFHSILLESIRRIFLWQWQNGLSLLWHFSLSHPAATLAWLTMLARQREKDKT